MENKSTHFLFDGQKIIISSDIQLTINFLMEIDKDIIKLLECKNLIRLKLIALFANLETLMRLNFAYENKISEGNKIRQLTLDSSVWRNFYSDFCLNKDNTWIKENIDRSDKISNEDLRYLRNSLTHFFSVDRGLQIGDRALDKKSREIEKQTNYNVKFISPEDLYEIIKGSAVIMMKKWNDDCIKCSKNQSEEFKERINAVNELVNSSGSVVVKLKD